MYIPTWLIVIPVVVGIYYFSRSKKQSKLARETSKEKFSYRLDITIDPHWGKLYKKICHPKSDKEWEKELEEGIKKSAADETLWDRRYHFTEYYDSATGLTSRFQRTSLSNGKQYFDTVNEFGDAGYIFEPEKRLGGDDEYRKKRNKSSVQVGEDFIRNDIFEKVLGGLKEDFDCAKENYIFCFPLYEVFNFLFALGQRFQEIEGNAVIKWPDYIEKKFAEYSIEYKTYFDYEPELFDIEKHDKEFFEKFGKPKIALFSNEKGFLISDGTYYGIKLKIFRPEENDRIGTLS